MQLFERIKIYVDIRRNVRPRNKVEVKHRVKKVTVNSPIIVDETRLQGVAVEGRGDEGAGYG